MGLQCTSWSNSPGASRTHSLQAPRRTSRAARETQITMPRPESTRSGQSGRLLFSPSELLQTPKSSENASISRRSPIHLRAQALRADGGCRAKLTDPWHSGHDDKASFLHGS